MASFHEYKRRAIMPLILAALGAYYLTIFQPLARKADHLDVPLQEAWTRLAGSLGQSNATAIDFLHITNQLAETRQALSTLENTHHKAAERLETAEAVRNRMAMPFELVEFESQRSRQLAALAKNAAAQGVSVAAGVYSGVPQHTFEVRDPAMLWPALAFTDELFATLLRCEVTAIQSLFVPVSLTNSPPMEPNRWCEIPLEIEFSGRASAVDSVVRSLPLRTEELGAGGLPPGSAEKSPLLIERMVLRKESPDQPDEVRAWIRVLGFARRNAA